MMQQSYGVAETEYVEQFLQGAALKPGQTWTGNPLSTKVEVADTGMYRVPRRGTDKVARMVLGGV